MSRRLRDVISMMLGRAPLRTQVAALCRDPETGDVLMITSRGTGRWIIPKGWPMYGRSHAESALQEAWEEAGVRGHVTGDEIGRYRYDKTETRRDVVPVEARVFPVEVSGLADDVPEQGQRERRWFHPVEAAELVAEDGLRRILMALPPVTTQAAGQ